MKKELVFDFKKFIHQKLPNGEKLKLNSSAVREFKKLDGMKIHKYNARSFGFRVLGYTHYLLVGSEKIPISEEFSKWKNATKN